MEMEEVGRLGDLVGWGMDEEKVIEKVKGKGKGGGGVECGGGLKVCGDGWGCEVMVGSEGGRGKVGKGKGMGGKKGMGMG